MTENDENVIAVYRCTSGVLTGAYAIALSDNFSKTSVMIFAARFGAIAEHENIDFAEWFFTFSFSKKRDEIVLYNGVKTSDISFHSMAEDIVKAIVNDKEKKKATVLVTVKGVPLQVAS